MPIKFGNQEYLMKHEVAKLIGVDIQTIRRWDEAGKLKATRHPINKYRLYKMSAVKKLLAKLNGK
jgi:excisionase family DNA binding protein